MAIPKSARPAAVITALLGVASVAPPLGLRIYIQQTLDFNARWLAVKYAAPQMAVWVAFVFSFLVFVVKLLQARGAVAAEAPSDQTAATEDHEVVTDKDNLYRSPRSR